MDEKEDYWKIYDKLESWIKFADTKAIAFIAIIGVVFNIHYKISEKIIDLSNCNIIKILYFVSIILLSASLIFSICCLIPRSSKTDEKSNVIYYKSINDNFGDEQSYYESIRCIGDDFNEQLCSQNYQLAKVATTKYSKVKCSLILFLTGFLVFLVVLLMLVIFHV